jgi:hypothetical protein
VVDEGPHGPRWITLRDERENLVVWIQVILDAKVTAGAPRRENPTLRGATLGHAQNHRSPQVISC